MGEVYVFDIDGTLADISHRLHYIQKKPKDWDSFFEACAHDRPIPHMIGICCALMCNLPVVFVSGRSDQVRHATKHWLAINGLYGLLYMRKRGDFRPDYVVKEELLNRMVVDGLTPVMVFDDRDQVVQMWRARGIPCAQVANGKF